MRNIWWNVIVASLVFLFTFILSIINNTWITSLIRSISGFILFFLLMYPFRLLFQIILIKPTKGDQGESKPIESQINVKTPDEDLLKEISKSQQQSEPYSNDFTPLSPPIIQKKKSFPDMTPKDIANAVRVLSDE